VFALCLGAFLILGAMIRGQRPVTAQGRPS